MTNEQLFQRLYDVMMALDSEYGLKAMYETGNRTTLTGAYDIVNLLLDVKDAIADAADKSAGRGNIAKTVKAVLRNAKKVNIHTRYNDFFAVGDVQYATDGPRLIRLKGTKRLDMATKESNIRFEDVIAGAKSSVSITLPEKSILKTLISITPKSEKALFPLENGAKMDARYLLELLNLFDGDNDYYAYMKDADTPLYICSKDTDESITALLMPCRTEA